MNPTVKLLTLALGAAAFSVIFTHTLPGLNYLLFLALSAGLLAASDRKARQADRLVPFLGLALLYAAPVFLYGKEVMAVLFWPVWIMGGTLTAYGWKVLPLAGAGGVLSHIASPLILAGDHLRGQKASVGQGVRRLAIYGLCAAVFLVFTGVYSGTSTALAATLSQLPELDLGDCAAYVFFGVLGLVIMAGWLHPWLPALALKADAWLPERVAPDRASLLSRMLGLNPADEYRPALVLMAALTVLAAYAALGDAYYLLSPEGLPKGVTFSGFLHDSVEEIGLAVALTAALAGLLFRDAAHHQGTYRRVRMLFYAFLGANLLMVAVAWGKNAAYIDAYSLSFNRIGVYVWLGLVAGGLVLTAIKLDTERSFFWLARTGLWLAVTAFGIYHLIPTDRMVRMAHLARPEKMDLRYLVENLSAEETALLALEIPDKLLMAETGIEALNGLDAQGRRKAILQKYARSVPEERGWLSETVAHLQARRALEARQAIPRPWPLKAERPEHLLRPLSFISNS